jgi:hypothetical protein
VNAGVYRYVKLDLRLHSVVVGTCLQYKDIDSFEVEPVKDISLICGFSLVNVSPEDEVSQMYPVDKFPYRYFFMQEGINGNMG